MEESKVPALLEQIRKNEPVPFELLCQALIGPQTTLRARAATGLGDLGDMRAIPHLIDALSDESHHVGANYSDPGYATTRHCANQALIKLTGQDFGFKWDDSPEKRLVAIRDWTRWYMIRLMEKDSDS